MARACRTNLCTAWHEPCTLGLSSLPSPTRPLPLATASLHCLCRIIEPLNTLRESNSPAACAPQLRAEIERAAHLLPAQGPIEVFVHHNTLHCFERQPFHEAVQAGLARFGAQPYLPEKGYRKLRQQGRIAEADLVAVVGKLLGARGSDRIANLCTREELYLTHLRHPVHVGADAELRWQIAETDALDRFRADAPPQARQAISQAAQRWLCAADSEDSATAELRADLQRRFGSQQQRWGESCWTAAGLHWLWLVCQAGVQHWPPRQPPRRSPRPRDLLWNEFHVDIDRWVQEVLTRFAAAYLDQGYSSWTMPQRDLGFYEAFLSLYSRDAAVADRWLRDLPQELRAMRAAGVTPEQSIQQCLHELQIAAADREEFIVQSLLALRGWAGMVWQLESGVDWVVHAIPTGSLLGMLAIQLLLERHAIRELGRSKAGRAATVADTLSLARRSAGQRRDSPTQTLHLRHAFHLFQVAQLLGWAPDQLLSLAEDQWQALGEAIVEVSELRRRQIFQEAYERHYQQATLSAFSHETKQRSQRPPPEKQPAPLRPAFQLTTCIDDREESFRRHLEEAAPACETFGAAGFFAVAIYYRGVADGFYKPLCPGVITPDHYVQEDVGYTFEGVHRGRAELRRRLGWASHLIHTRSRTFLGGIAAGILGSLATAPLVARVLFPRLTARIRQRFGSLLRPPPVTRLQLERYADEPGPDNGHIGYTPDEMAHVVVRLLEDIGLTRTADFSRLFILCGHGSSSLNNPHESAYCCGACAGKRGGPNARAFAEMANDWRVRAKAAKLGIEIPEDTCFVGAYHNTCDDSVVFYDLDQLPASHREDFETAREAIEAARRRNAHERCRRFHDASLDWSPREALRHVEGRAQDISQARPEYNHATNALCIVGRRDWTRGLFLDRRAFLTSYDHARDDEEHSILARILAAAIPVCAGINLEYYFSCVDNSTYGSGSKLPHNLVSMLGVMEGTASDLRTGLYQQMVEIHEPLRLLFVIECSADAMLSIMERNETIRRLCEGCWVHLAVIDPETGSVQWFEDGEFTDFQPVAAQLPRKESSLACYQGSREHLPVMAIGDKGAD